MGLLAKPLGWLMWLVYEYIGFHNYFLTIFLFTLITRIILFPLSLKNQKSMMDRARLAPRLERIQKKYAKDQQKLMQKQQELYEKEGVSQFGGCLPSVVTMIVLFGVIAVIYSPLNYLIRIPSPVVNAAISASTLQKDEVNENKFAEKDMRGYYGEFRMLNHLEQNKADIVAAIADVEGQDKTSAEGYYKEMAETKKEFTVFGKYSLLENPWRGGAKDISLLWLLPIFAGLSQLLMTMVSMHFTKRATKASNEMQQAQGCTNAMMYGMPVFSLIIGFTFPAGVSVYWVASSLIGVCQTLLLYKIYDPAKAREQAEIEYQAARKQRAADKKRLAEARKRQDAAENAPDATDAPNVKDLGDITPDELPGK